MSETTSFLGGAALAGLAAVVLLKGGVGNSSPTIPSQPLPNYNYSVPPAVPTAPPSPIATTSADFDKQKAEIEQLRAIVEQQRIQTEQFKTQLQSQQALIETLNTQNKVAVPAPQRTANPTSENNSVLSNLLWMLGGVILTFGGGIALVGMFVLFAKQQRPSRTIEVIHDEYPGYLSNRRRTQVLPARRSIRRVEAEEID
ncbi:hypothetical protein H6F51_17770 [Cyanobacteria bacterium FACHB-DQ100]|nr:hypothetical protein [Cyanobacteria bacterium FACHB-DQ100]